MWIDLSEWAGTFASHVNAHLRVTSAEEDFSVGPSQPLPPALSPPRGLLSTVAVWRGGGGTWAQQCGSLLTKADPASAEASVGPLKGHLPGRPGSYVWHRHRVGPLPSRAGQRLLE